MNNEKLDDFDERSGEVLAEYDHIIDMQRQDDHDRAMEGANWDDLQIMVRGGLLTPEQAMSRHLIWLAGRGKSLI